MKFVNLSLSWPLLAGLLLGALLGAALGYFAQCTSGTCPLTSTWWRGALYGAFLGLLFAFSASSPRTRGRETQNPPRAEGAAGAPRQP
ncbi:MAG: DUF6132 family protein [Chthoniobacterales bacterium]